MKRIRFQDHWHGWFYCETYRANIDIIWPVNAKRVKAFVKHRYDMDVNEDDNFGAKCCEIMESSGRQTQLICMRDWRKDRNATDYSFLAHECFHATTNILSLRGLPLQNRISSEAYAFLLESIMRQSLELLDTSRKP